MNKKNWFTGLGMLLSISLALGGWQVVGRMLEIKERELISPEESRSISTMEGSGEEIAIKEEQRTDGMVIRPILPEKEIAKIIESWDSDKPEHPHDPWSGQLKLEDAIRTGEAWLKVLGQEIGIPVTAQPSPLVNAYLCNKETDKNISEDRYPYYSYWWVTFSGEEGQVSFKINAMTGEAWYIKVHPAQPDISFAVYCSKQTLEAFVARLSVKTETGYSKSNYGIFAKLAETDLYAEVCENQVSYEKPVTEKVVQSEKGYELIIRLTANYKIN